VRSFISVAAVSCFTVSSVVAFYLIEGSERLFQRPTAAGPTHENLLAHTKHGAKQTDSSLAGSLSDRLQSRTISPEELDRAIHSCDLSDIRAVFRIGDHTFWSESPLAPSFVRRASERLSAHGLASASSEISTLLVELRLPDPLMRRLASAGFAGCLATAKWSRADMSRALQSTDPKLRRPLLRACAHQQLGREPAEMHDSLLETWRAAGLAEEKDFLQWCIRTVMETWMPKDSEATMRFALSAGGDELATLRDSMRLLSLASPESAEKKMLELAERMDSRQLGDIYSQAGFTLAQLADIARQLTLPKKEQLLVEYYKRQDSLQIVEFASAFSPKDLPSAIAQDVCTDLLMSQPGALHHWLSTVEQADRNQLLDKAMEKAMENEAAAEAYLGLRGVGEPLPEKNLQKIIGAIATRDFGKAQAVINSLRADQRELATRSAYRSHANALLQEPDRLVEFIGTAPREIKEELVTETATQLQTQSTEHALAFCARLEEPLRVIAEARVLAEPDVPLPLLERVVLDAVAKREHAEHYTTAVESLVTRYAMLDSQKAIECIARIPEEAMKTHAISAMVSKWCSYDPISASEWIVGLPKGKIRDQALYHVSTAAFDDLERAFENVAAINERSLRRNAIDSLLAKWQTVDINLARNALRNSGLSEGDKAEFLPR
jgi:hypothetical protein